MNRLVAVTILLLAACGPKYGAPRPKQFDSRPGGDITWQFTEEYNCFFEDLLERRDVLDSDESRGRYKYHALEGDPICDVIARSGRPYRIDHLEDSETWWYSTYDPSVARAKRVPGEMIDTRGADELERQLEVRVVVDSTRQSPDWPRSHWWVARATYQRMSY